jgi:hypothetical protein
MEPRRDLFGNTIATIIVAPVIVMAVAYVLLNLALVTQLFCQDVLHPATAIPMRFE